MPGNRKQLRNGGLSNSSDSAVDKVEEGVRRLKMESSNDNGRVGDEPDAYPDRPGEPDCIFYLRTGTCGYGSNCRFNHPSNTGGHVHFVKKTIDLPERAGERECRYYLKTGTCKFGSTCKYHHPKDRQVDSTITLNILGLPMRQDSKPCPYYMWTGQCKYGYACKFHHPQPPPSANMIPVVGTVYGSVGSGIVPSAVVPSAEPLAAPLPKSTYFSSSLLQLPQSYMPLMLSPSQGWNTYMESISPLSVGSVLSSPASNGLLSASYLPDRPDQPQCPNFMNHGSCNYGPECKFHHPRERISQYVSSSIGPFGLPLRPDQPACLHYSLYGLCKYGPTCKFDHPIHGGYSYAYGPSLPYVATSYSPPVTYQRSQSFVPSSETSPSRSSKVNDWIKKDATAKNKNRHSNTKSSGDSPTRSDSLPRSSKASSEAMQNESG